MARQVITSGAGVLWSAIKTMLNDMFTELYAKDASHDSAIALKADALGADDNYATDAEKVKLSNLSGTNTGDQTPTSLGLVIGTNVQAYDSDLTTWGGITPASGVGAMLAIAPGSTGGATRVIASGTASLGTSAIASGESSSIVTVSATGVVTTDVIEWGFNTRPSQVAGYAPLITGCLRIDAYPTADNVNFEVSNMTLVSITPSAIVLNWRVRR